MEQRDYDLFTAAIGVDGPSGAEVVAGINSPQDDSSPAVSPSGDFVYFTSDRPGGHGGFDLGESVEIYEVIREFLEAHGLD